MGGEGAGGDIPLRREEKGRRWEFSLSSRTVKSPQLLLRLHSQKQGVVMPPDQDPIAEVLGIKMNLAPNLRQEILVGSEQQWETVRQHWSAWQAAVTAHQQLNLCQVYGAPKRSFKEANELSTENSSQAEGAA